MNNNDIAIQLDSMKDDIKCIDKAIDMFYDIQSKQGPLIEVITIMKVDNPKLFALLKTRFERHPRFNLLFELVVDYDFARRSLGFDY